MFDWGAGDGESVVSKYIWVFVVLALGLTCLTVLAWRFGTSRVEALARKKLEGTGHSVSGTSPVSNV